MNIALLLELYRAHTLCVPWVCIVHATLTYAALSLPTRTYVAGCAHEQRAYSYAYIVGMVNGHGYDGQQKYTSCMRLVGHAT